MAILSSNLLFSLSIRSFSSVRIIVRLVLLNEIAAVALTPLQLIFLQVSHVMRQHSLLLQVVVVQRTLCSANLVEDHNLLFVELQLSDLALTLQISDASRK